MSRNRIEEAQVFLADRTSDPTDLRERMASSNPVYAGTLIRLLQCKDKRVKNRAAKLIAALSEKEPAVVYPHWDTLSTCVTGHDTILKWNALISIGFMAGVDDGAKIRLLLPTLFELLRDPSMVTAAHAVSCLGRIAAWKAQYRSEILDQLLNIDQGQRNPECHQILVGKVLRSLQSIVPNADPRALGAIRRFAERQESSSRFATQKLAAKLGKELERPAKRL